MNIIFLSKDNAPGRAARAVLARRFPEADVRVWLAAPGDRLPAWDDWSCDYLISYLCPRLLPAPILAAAGLPINFHPAPPEYPGLGCYNFALYDGVAEYGATCHRMVEQIDSGEIYAVRRFPVPAEMTVVALQERTLAEMLALLDEVLATVAAGRPLAPVARWARGPTTRQDFEALRQVPLDADAEEVARRVRAFAHPDHDGAYIRLHGIDFLAVRPQNAKP